MGLKARYSLRIPPVRMARKALSVGITGQDGDSLAELLLCKGYKVLGVVRRAGSSIAAGWRPSTKIRVTGRIAKGSDGLEPSPTALQFP
jgi:hypothetical protein